MKKTIIAIFLVALAVFLFFRESKPEITEAESVVVVDTRVQQVENYFRQRKMPLLPYAKKMVEVADKNGLDWRLLPAISVRESSGGLHMCKNNPFGWGSCKIGFKSIDESIDVVGYKLANLPVYKGKTTERKLYYYNGTVIKAYPAEVIAIMNKIK